MSGRPDIVVSELNNETIESMIYEIRGQKVMLDYELAKIYGYETRAFNQQVQRNIKKFPDDFMFQLSKRELEEILTSQNVISSWGGNRKLPHAFTEQGIYMLMTVLKGELATKQSIALVRAFKSMKDYIVENNQVLTLQTIKYINNKFASYDKRFEQVEEKLEIVMDNFIDPSKYKHCLILNGEKIEADIAYQNIYKKANESIFIIDDYIDIKTLQLLKVVNEGVEVTIFTDNKARNNLTREFIDDFKSDTDVRINFKQNNNRFHDRYIVIDYETDNEEYYHCGASSKDAGKKITTITKLEDTAAYKSPMSEILNNNELTIE